VPCRGFTGERKSATLGDGESHAVGEIPDRDSQACGVEFTRDAHCEARTMKAVRSVVYAPPAPEFPYLAVIFGGERGVSISEPFATREEAERFIADLAGNLWG
jgi:hypothetical protein